MKKKLFLLMLFFVFFFNFNSNVKAAVDSSGLVLNSSFNGGGGPSYNGTIVWGASVNQAGMRVSVMVRTGEGKNGFTVIAHQDYLQHKFGNYFNVHVNKGTSSQHGTRYEYLSGKQETVNWYDDQGKIKNNYPVLDSSWSNFSDYFGAGVVCESATNCNTGTNYADLESFTALLGQAPSSGKIEDSNAYKFLTGKKAKWNKNTGEWEYDGCPKIGGYTISGLGLNAKDLEQYMCGQNDVFIMIEPMTSLIINKIPYHGTVTELATIIYQEKAESGNRFWNGDRKGLSGVFSFFAYINKSEDTIDGIHYKFPMHVPYNNTKVLSNGKKLTKSVAIENSYTNHYAYLRGGSKLMNQLQTDEDVGSGNGIHYAWIGWMGTDCGEVKCYDVDVQQSVTAAACTDSEEDRTIEIEQRFIESDEVCKSKTEEEKKTIAKQTNYKGNLITGSGDVNNYCGIYCSDSARIVYPTKLSSEIALDASGRLDTAVVWPDTENHKFTIQITRTCKGHVVGDVNSISGGTTACTQAIVNNTYFKSSNVASTVSFSYDDTYYGKDSSKIVVKMEDVGTVTCSGDCGSISKDNINDRSFTLTIKRQGVLDKTKSHSKYNMLTDRYAIGTETLTSGVTYDRGQIAISREAGSAVNSASTTSDKRKVFSMNLTITNLGYNNNLISSGKLAGKSQAAINAYTCNYKVNGGGTCASCMSEETGNAYDVCCLEQTEADAYDKYCERGYLKKEYDTEAWRNKISKACSCVQTTNGQVVLYNMYDNSNGSCMKTYYNNNTKNNRKVSYDDAYNYCLNQAPFSTVCDDGGSNTKYCEKADGSTVDISSCMANNNNNLEYCVEENCPKVYACPNGDTSKTTSIKACIKQGNTEEYCETKYCSVCTDSSGKEISLTDCLNENNNDVDLCKAELCPVTSGKTCKEVATSLGTTVASQAENVDLTECIETQINQNNKNENDAKRYCLERKCNVCSETSKLHAGEVITEELIGQYGSVENVQKNYCDVCPTCITSCMCPRGTAGYPKFVTDIAKQYLTTGAATTEEAACKLAQDNYCNETPENDTYLYHTIDLESPFVSSNLSATASAKSRTPGVNWGLSDSLSGTSVSLTEKYITSTQNVYDVNNEPMYTINLTSSVINQIRNYNDSHDYGDFTLNCDYQGKVSTGVGRSVGWCLSTFLRDQSYMKTSIETTSGACYTTSSAINNAIINKLNACKG